MGKGRAPCCDKSKVKQGPWSPSEDLRLINFIQNHGHSNWRALPKLAGLMRCGKSCRLRWINYLRPDVKRGNFTSEEEQTIINLHKSFGNKWSKIASYLPGRTDNEIKNVWNTHLKKRLLPENTKNHKNIIISSSIASSSIDDPQNLENVPHIKIREPADDQATKEPHDENPENPKSVSTNPRDHDRIITEAKEPVVSSDSPTSSSYASSWISDAEKIVIPVDMDIDFLQFFDSPDHHDYLQFSQLVDIAEGGQINLVDHQGGEGSEIDQRKWLRFVENELGLTSDEDFDNLLQFHHDVDLLPEDYSLLESDSYFPLWP